jgi:hypothetical protein
MVPHNGQTYLLLQDPLHLSDKTLLVPRALQPILLLCDGTREDPAELRASAAIRFGVRVPPDQIRDLLIALDDALLLDNERAAQARSAALAAYRDAPARPLRQSMDADPEMPGALRRRFDTYDTITVAASPTEPAVSIPFELAAVRGLLSPHIDYHRGGTVYAGVWRRAAESAQQADLVVILGTNHNGSEHLLALTRQRYATPFGVLETDADVVDRLAAALGEDAALAGELYHRGEHAVELAANWLHYVQGAATCPIVPVLCGSFHRFISEDADPDASPLLNDFIASFAEVTAGRRVLVVAAGDLAHVGPAFGGAPLTREGREQVRAADAALFDAMVAGDAAGFLEEIRRVDDRYNVCGVPPIYLALRLLAPVQGAPVGYDLCTADAADTSVVSIGGLLWA